MTTTMTTVLEHSQEPLAQTLDKREQLLSKIRGQTIRIPDLKCVFADWKGIDNRHISPWTQKLEHKVNERLRSLNFHGAKQKRLEKSNFGAFTALWWPDASLERLEILAYLVIWLFTWDDEIDEPTGTFSENFNDAQAYRDQTLLFVQESLGLSTGKKTHIRSRNGIIQSFDVIGAALRACYDENQKQRFCNEIAKFMKASEIEQRWRLLGHIPTIEEYWAFRLGTSAVYIGSAAGEYSMGAHLPLEVMNSAAMRAIWDETNIIISITNDLLSLKKEIRLGCIDSIVPLTLATTNDLHEAIKLSVAALEASKQRFDAAATDLLSVVSQAKDMHEQVRQFIQVQRSNCVGNLVWSLETQRYDVSGHANEDGILNFTL
ncbi:isoprenoid synthase domain-containing protein [Xylariaceae sp. FL0255]|nr:isoprenoid synthase domain-containing protein [Xylariaceae sp. FL0255]